MITCPSTLVRTCVVSFLIPLAGLLHGQGNFAEFPYNPDANGDDFVGTSDLLALLNLYGSEFSEEGLYVNEDSTAAIVHVGSLNYPKCAYQCKSLPGSWRVATLEDLGMIWDEINIPTNPYRFWLGERESGKNPPFIENHTDGPIVKEDEANAMTMTRDCYCSTAERPKVEYTYCSGEYIYECAEEKTQAGWIPLQGVSTKFGYNYTNVYGSIIYPVHFTVQAFWRWAE